MSFFRNQSKLRDILFILAGTLLMSVAVNMVYDPLGMVTGGVTGIGIVVKHLTRNLFPGGVPVWLTNVLCNVPLFLAAVLVLGKRFLGKTLFATVSMTVFLYLLPVTPLFREDYLLASVFGGVIAGAGIGLVLAASATTGGTDLLCAIIHKKLKHYSVPQLLIVVDGLVVLGGVAVFGINESLYAAIAIFITAKMSDGILEGLKFSKMAYIVSEHSVVIAEEIMQQMDRGVTALQATGMYSGKERKMLLCVVSKKEIAAVLDIVNRNDRNAFVIISDAREVMGEGFIENVQ